jgi:hypothetical protein
MLQAPVPLTLPESRTAQKRKTKTNHERINPQQQQQSQNLQSPSQKPKKNEKKTPKKERRSQRIFIDPSSAPPFLLSLSLQLSLPSLPSRPAFPPPPTSFP